MTYLMSLQRLSCSSVSSSLASMSLNKGSCGTDPLRWPTWCHAEGELLLSQLLPGQHVIEQDFSWHWPFNMTYLISLQRLSCSSVSSSLSSMLLNKSSRGTDPLIWPTWCPCKGWAAPQSAPPWPVFCWIRVLVALTLCREGFIFLPCNN